MADTPPPAAGAPKRFSRRFDLPKLAPDAASRQGTVTRLAFERLGRDAAIDYLNAEHAGLGGRPLALATASIEGFDRVLDDLALRAAPPLRPADNAN